MNHTVSHAFQIRNQVLRPIKNKLYDHQVTIRYEVKTLGNGAVRVSFIWTNINILNVLLDTKAVQDSEQASLIVTQLVATLLFMLANIYNLNADESDFLRSLLEYEKHTAVFNGEVDDLVFSMQELKLIELVTVSESVWEAALTTKGETALALLEVAKL